MMVLPGQNIMTDSFVGYYVANHYLNQVGIVRNMKKILEMKIIIVEFVIGDMIIGQGVDINPRVVNMPYVAIVGLIMLIRYLTT